MKVGSLFTGIGGLDLGFERAGFEIAWMCEIDPYARKVLNLRFPGVPVYEDITKLENPPAVDVLIGGFPCQDISSSGKRKGIDEGERSSLWREFTRLIRVLRPRYVVVENVSALLRPHRKERKPAPISRVLGDLAESRYDAEWTVLSAEAFGAPHLRERVFIVAYPMCEGLERQRLPAFHTQLTRRPLWGVGVSESSVLRARHGVPFYMERIEGLGNAVVPDVAEWVGRQILKREGVLV